MITGFVLLIILDQLLSVKRNKKKSFISSAVVGVLAYVGFIYLINELLSIFNLISTASLALSWIVLDLVLIVECSILARNNRNEAREWLSRKLRLIKKKKTIIAIFLLFSTLVIYIAINAVPNNWDSLSYHLPRVIFWLNQGSVKHFATNDTRMLGSPPLKEFVDLHVYALIGKSYDSFLILTQAFSYLLNVSFVWLLSKEVGLSRKGRRVAAILYAAAPIAVAEAFTTQNDQFSTLFVLLFVILSVRISRKISVIGINRKTASSLGLLGICAAFAYLSKPSGMFVLLTFSLWILVLVVAKRKKFITILFCCTCVACAAGITVLPEISRNIMTYGNVMDPWQGPGQIASTLDPRYLMVNALKNIGTNINYSVSPKAMSAWERAVDRIAGILAVDKNDPRIAEKGMPYILSVDRDHEYGHDTASNPLQSIFILAMGAAGLMRVASKKNRITGFEIGAFLSFLLMIVFIKWERFMTRYMACGFSVAIPAAVLVLERLFPRNKRMLCLVIGAMGVMGLGACMDYAIQNNIFSYRRLASKELVYAEGDNIKVFRDAIKKYRFTSIGYDLGCSGTDSYPVLHMMDLQSDEIYMVNVDNDTKKYEKRQTPEAIVVDCSTLLGETSLRELKEYWYDGVKYTNIEKITERTSIVWIDEKKKVESSKI